MPPVKKKQEESTSGETENGIRKSNDRFLYGCDVNGIFTVIIMWILNTDIMVQCYLKH